MAKLLYKPVGLLVGVIAGFAAAQLFQRVWTLISDEPPANPEDPEAGWREIVVATALQSVVFATVRALIQRGGAKGFERVTGIWPGDEPED